MAKYLSPTAIKKYQACHRRWGYNYLIPDNREVSGPAAAFGTEVHAVNEAYLLRGTQPDASTKAGRLALEGLPYLPAPPLTRECVESEFRFTFGGVPLGGKRDLVEPPPMRARLRLCDWKTSGGNPAHILTPVSLLEDVAVNVYSLGTMLECDSEALDLFWLYYITSGRPRVLPPVEASITLDQARAWVEANVLADARAMWALYSESRPWTAAEVCSELAYCRGACNDFGRVCPYMGTQCTFERNQIIMGAESSPEERCTTLADRLRAQAAAKAGKPAPEPAAPAQAEPAAAGGNLDPKYDWSKCPDATKAVIAGLDHENQVKVATAMGFPPPLKPEPKPEVPALPAQTAPVNPPEASLATAPKTRGKGKQAQVEPANPAVPVIDAGVWAALGLEPGEEAVFEISTTVRVKRTA